MLYIWINFLDIPQWDFQTDINLRAHKMLIQKVLALKSHQRFQSSSHPPWLLGILCLPLVTFILLCFKSLVTKAAPSFLTCHQRPSAESSPTTIRFHSLSIYLKTDFYLISPSSLAGYSKLQFSFSDLKSPTFSTTIEFIGIMFDTTQLATGKPNWISHLAPSSTKL